MGRTRCLCLVSGPPSTAQSKAEGASSSHEEPHLSVCLFQVSTSGSLGPLSVSAVHSTMHGAGKKCEPDPSPFPLSVHPHH